MAQRAPSSREEERRLSMRTLVIASIASAIAALVVSRFFVAGTWVAAALTPVIVALVSEMLHRPTQVISGRITSERTALMRDRPGRAETDVTRRLPAPGGEEEQPEVTVYGAAPRERGRRRKLALGVVLVTGLLGFAIAAAAMTVPELIGGHALFDDDRGSTILGGKGKEKKETTTPEETVTETVPPPPARTVTTPAPETTPQRTVTTPAPEATTPTTTTTAP